MPIGKSKASYIVKFKNLGMHFKSLILIGLLIKKKLYDLHLRYF